ncbi:MAG: Gldg family protein [Myxococcota bacterium]|nr:Gldg family protein [Myxococcota bacterium]
MKNTPSKLSMTNIGRIAGAVGLVLLISLPFTYLLTLEFGPAVLGKLFVGLGAILLYVVTNKDSLQQFSGAKSSGLFALSSLSTLAVLTLLVAINIAAQRDGREWDITREGIHTLSPQTEKLLSRVKEKTTLYGFYGPTEPLKPVAEELIKRYAGLSKNIEHKIIDPQTRPDLVERFSIADRGPRIVVASETQDARAKEVTEEELTNALIRVVDQTTKTIHFLVGHGEVDLHDGENNFGAQVFGDSLKAEGYKLAPLSLIDPSQVDAPGPLDINTQATPSSAIQIPKDVRFLLILGPEGNLLEPEITAILEFLNRGGRVVAMLDRTRSGGFHPIANQWRIQLREDMIVDPNPLNRMLGLGPAAPMVVPSEAEHPITSQLSAAVVMMTARSLGLAASPSFDVEVIPLLRAGQTAWGETNLIDGIAEQGDDDNLEATVAYISTKKIPKANLTQISDEARLVTFGDSDWITNKYFSMQGNADLSLNTIHWLTEEQAKITIRPKLRVASQLNLDGRAIGYLKFLSMDILPVLLVAFGLAIVLIRRQR